jgi:hypothetical protein
MFWIPEVGYSRQRRSRLWLGAAAEVVEDVVGEAPNTAETGAHDGAADVPRAGADRDTERDESTESTWADDRTTDLDPGRVGSDDQQAPSERSEGEPDE